MKRFFLLLIVMIFSFQFSTSNAWFDDLFENKNTAIPYCQWDKECGIEQGIQEVNNSWIDWVVTEWKASDYIQSIVVYLLWFIAIIWVILIIYSWFRLLVSWWNEDQMTNSKKIIISVVIGIIIIFLAGPITNFVIDVVSQNPEVTEIQ